MKIIVMGASGMLGHLLYSEFGKNHQTWGTVRDKAWTPDLLSGYGIENLQKVDQLISDKKPDYVINCIGAIKQLNIGKQKISSIEVNSLWPHRLSEICDRHNAKLIHFSTDCVFSGSKGNYLESDLADARDIYGLSKYMGELDYSHTLTLRTSIIGHELNTSVSLINWFMSQRGKCKGFSKAIFSGFPTIVIAKFLEQYILNNFISGVYQFSSEPISKYELLKLVASEYKKDITMIPSEDLIIDRSLNSNRLRETLNFKPDSWPLMISQMHEHYQNSGLYKNKEIK